MLVGRAIALALLLQHAHGLNLSPRVFTPLFTPLTVTMNDEIAHAVFDAEECIVGAESAAEAQSCMKAPGEPEIYKFYYAGDSPKEPRTTGPLMTGRGARADNDLDECITDAENIAEIQDCRSDYAVASVDEEGCEMIGETADEVCSRRSAPQSEP